MPIGEIGSSEVQGRPAGRGIPALHRMKVRNNGDSLREGNASPLRGAIARALRTCLVFPEKRTVCAAQHSVRPNQLLRADGATGLTVRARICQGLDGAMVPHVSRSAPARVPGRSKGKDRGARDQRYARGDARSWPGARRGGSRILRPLVGARNAPRRASPVPSGRGRGWPTSGPGRERSLHEGAGESVSSLRFARCRLASFQRRGSARDPREALPASTRPKSGCR